MTGRAVSFLMLGTRLRRARQDACILGVLNGGAGPTDWTDITYATPYWWIEQHIKAKYPNAFLYSSRYLSRELRELAVTIKKILDMGESNVHLFGSEHFEL